MQLFSDSVTYLKRTPTALHRLLSVSSSPLLSYFVCTFCKTCIIMGFIIWCRGTEYIFINSGLTFSVDEKCYKAAGCLYRNWFPLRNNARIWETIYIIVPPKTTKDVTLCWLWYLNQPLCTETSQDLFSFILHWIPWWLIIKTSTEKVQSSHWRAQSCAAMWQLIFH